jgi:hypothetical protein
LIAIAVHYSHYFRGPITPTRGASFCASFCMLELLSRRKWTSEIVKAMVLGLPSPERVPP